MVAFSSRMSGLAGRLRPLPGQARVAGFRHSPAGRAVQWVHRRVSAVNKAGGSKTKGGEGDRVRPRHPPLPGGFVALPQLVLCGRSAQSLLADCAPRSQQFPHRIPKSNARRGHFVPGIPLPRRRLHRPGVLLVLLRFVPNAHGSLWPGRRSFALSRCLSVGSDCAPEPPRMFYSRRRDLELPRCRSQHGELAME